MIKAAIFDVDKTLLSHKGRCIPKSAVHAIEDLRKDGMLIIIATGRPVYALEELDEAGVQYDYVVGCNGHCVFEKEELLDASYFTFEQVQQLTDYCLENDYILLWKYSDKNYVYNGVERMVEIHEKMQIEEPFVECKERNHHHKILPFGAVVYAPQEEVMKYANEIDPSLIFFEWTTDCFDVSLKAVSKLTGLEQLLKKIDLQLDECIAFGDGSNDLEVLQSAGIGVAMKECHPSLLEVCDYQTDDCLEDGIAKGLFYYQLIDEIRR